MVSLVRTNVLRSYFGVSNSSLFDSFRSRRLTQTNLSWIFCLSFFLTLVIIICFSLRLAIFFANYLLSITSLTFFCWFSLLIFYVFFVFLVVNSTWRLWRVGFCVFVFLSLWSVVFRKWNDNRHWRGFMKSVSPGIWLAKKKKCLVMAKKLLKPFHFFINEIVVDVFMLGNAIRMSYSVILKLSSRQSHFQS